jgi:competence protein ComEC
VQHIDLLVISHLDSDHIRGLAAVLETIPVRRIWWNGTVKQAEDAENLLQLALERNIPLYGAYEGMTAKLDNQTELSVLWPPEPKTDRVDRLQEQNEHSVVLRIDMQQSSFLFSGDINSATESEIVRRQREAAAGDKPLPVSVMKVAHHGSRFSTGAEWLAYYQPYGAVASVGAANTYGHPHPDTLGRLGQAGAVVWRTDRDGEVSFRTYPGGKLELRTIK